MLLLKASEQASAVSHAERQLMFEGALAIDGSIDIDSIDDNALTASAIEINIPAFSDGRGFSVARHLRVNRKYAGILRATGNVLPDQLQSLFQLGFSEVLVGDVNLARHSRQDWLDANESILREQGLLPSYQEPAFVAQGSIWIRRRV